jgi:spermidine/putrescine transport system permease protein
MSVAQGIGAGERQHTAEEPPPPTPRARGRWSTPYLLLLPGMAWLVVFFVVPIVTLVSTSTQTRPSGAEIGVYRQTFRLANYVDTLSEYAVVFLRSFTYAFVATLLALLISYPLAYAIAFKAGRWRNVLLVLVVAPFFVSFLLRTIAWKQILADEAWVADVLRFLHVLGPQDHIINSAPAVVIGITYNFLPFMILPIYASLERVDPRLIEAAGDLYANGLTTLRKVTFPLSLPGVVAGAFLVFIPVTGEFVIPDLLGGSDTLMIGRTLWSEFFSNRDWPLSAAVAVVLLAILVVPIVVFQNQRLLRAEREGR